MYLLLCPLECAQNVQNRIENLTSFMLKITVATIRLNLLMFFDRRVFQTKEELSEFILSLGTDLNVQLKHL